MSNSCSAASRALPGDEFALPSVVGVDDDVEAEVAAAAEGASVPGGLLLALPAALDVEVFAYITTACG